MTRWGAGLVAVLLGAGAGSAQTAKQQQKAEVLVREARVLKEAWVYLELANADYGGHRAKAMKELEAACVALDKGVLQNGNPLQKKIATADDLKAAQIKFTRKHGPALVNPQAMSDLLLAESHAILTQVRPAFVQHKQPKMVKHVDDAIAQIKLGLKIK